MNDKKIIIRMNKTGFERCLVFSEVCDRARVLLCRQWRGIKGGVSLNLTRSMPMHLPCLQSGKERPSWTDVGYFWSRNSTLPFGQRYNSFLCRALSREGPGQETVGRWKVKSPAELTVRRSVKAKEWREFHYDVMSRQDNIFPSCRSFVVTFVYSYSPIWGKISVEIILYWTLKISELKISDVIGSFSGLIFVSSTPFSRSIPSSKWSQFNPFFWLKDHCVAGSGTESLV